MTTPDLKSQLPINYRDYIITVAEPASRANFQYIHVEYNGPGDRRWGTAGTVEECKTLIDENTIEILSHDNDLMEQRVKQLEETASANTTAMIKGSIVIEEYKKDVAKLKDTLANREACIDTLSGFVEEYLKVFEAKFDSDEGAFTYEQMEAYVKAANYMGLKYGKALFANMRRVQERMNALPCGL